MSQDKQQVHGDSEDLLAKWFARKGKRDSIFLATKFGYADNNALGYPTLRSDPEFVKAAREKSLKRLGVSKIDVRMG